MYTVKQGKGNTSFVENDGRVIAELYGETPDDDPAAINERAQAIAEMLNLLNDLSYAKKLNDGVLRNLIERVKYAMSINHREAVAAIAAATMGIMVSDGNK